MSCTRRDFVNALAGAVAASLTACTPQGASVVEESPEPVEERPREAVEKAPYVDPFEELLVDMGAWHYDEDADCYYQIGLPYCLSPASSLERLAIFVPGAYLEGERHGSAYVCTVDRHAKVGDFTASTAPIVMPVNSVRYEAQEPSAAFDADGIERYLKAGYVYVYTGLRGRSPAFESASNEIDDQPIT